MGRSEGSGKGWVEIERGNGWVEAKGRARDGKGLG